MNAWLTYWRVKSALKAATERFGLAGPIMVVWCLVLFVPQLPAPNMFVVFRNKLPAGGIGAGAGWGCENKKDEFRPTFLLSCASRHS